MLELQERWGNGEALSTLQLSNLLFLLPERNNEHPWAISEYI
jgi:hypothetical protein